ncbi:MAG: carbohydrate ABC transporter permease [Ruminococcus sp.]|nr:carbohydrate ABC transporter permease [Candidatus Apopatosoma intestinale]
MARVQKLRTRNHKVVLNRSVGGDLGITIFLVILGAFMFLPMYYAIIQSLKPLDELWAYPPKFYVVKPTGNNFALMFKTLTDSWVPFSRYIFNTVLISVAGTFGNLVCGSLAAYAVSKIKFPGRKLLSDLVTYSLMFHPTVAGIVNFMTMSKLGWVDTYLAIIIPAWGSTLGMFLMKQFMESSVADTVLESARLDGASEFRTYWTIAMPMVKPAWLTLIVYSFKDLWNTGSSIYIMSEQLKTFNYAIQQIVSGGIARAGVATAAAVVMMVVPVTVFIITQSNIIETMSTSGMKD